MANLQLPINQDHEVLGSEYCSGYKDAIGKWNTGFYCPASDESQDVFCCGTKYHKYCCTKKDQVMQAEVQDVTVLVGIIVGTSAAILIITLVSCFCCSCCLLYKKRNPSASSMYRFNNASDHSGVTNMYSLSNAASHSGTPISSSSHSHHHYHRMIIDEDQGNLLHNGGISHSHTLPHNLSHHSKSHQSDSDLISHDRQYGTLGRIPREQPPAYHDLPHSSYLVLPPQNIAIETTVVGELAHHGEKENEVVHSISHAVSGSTSTASQRLIFPSRSENEEQLFHSTKF